MSEYWGRYCQLTVQVKHGESEALDLSELRISFRVSQATVDSPKFAEIYIYNLSEETMNLLTGTEENSQIGQTVILEAGYQDLYDIVFKGRVFQYRRGRENPTDKFLCILAQSGEAGKYSVTSASLAAGESAKEEREHILKDLKSSGIESRYLNDITSQSYPRGRVLFGQSLDLLNRTAQNTESMCRIEDDQVTMIDENGKTDDEAVVLTPETGLIGMPQLTTEGLRFTALLNPKIKFGSQVQIDMTLIQTQLFDIEYGKQSIDQPNKDIQSATGKNGFYNVCSAEYYGDTRGDTWYVDGVAVGVDAIPPKSGISISAVKV